MGSSTNRSLRVKAERARRQMRELAMIENMKPLNARHTTIAAANAVRAEVVVMVQSFNGQIVHGPKGPKPEPIGKRRARFQRATYGNFKPRLNTRPALDWDVNKGAVSVLIPRP